MTWDDYFIAIAEVVKLKSKDPNTQIGVVITNSSHKIVSTGYNGFPSKVDETEERWKRPDKYNYVSHAEINAICAAANQGTSLRDCTLYASGLLICQDCAKAIIQSGISRVVAEGKYALHWLKSNAIAKTMFNEAGVTYNFSFYTLEGVEIEEV